MCKDIKYNISTNNRKQISRSDTIIVFENKERLNLINNLPLEEFFVEITFKLIHECFKLYKLMTLSSINYKENKPILIFLIFFRYMDSNLYYNILKYLNEIYQFQPKIID